MSDRAWFWIIFNVVVIGLLVLDLAVFHRKSREIKFRESLLWVGFWVSLALGFGVGVYYWMGSAKALEYFTGYLIEYSLSTDNLFVFLTIFAYFQVPKQHQYKVLFWGIIGALVMRAIFIFGGVWLVTRFHWLIYVFGAFLLYTGYKMIKEHGKKIEPEKNPVLRYVRRHVPVTEQYHDDHFFIVRNGTRYATPMFIVLLVVESTDVVFAIDSIPAILAITQDPFIVYTSNVFAILGLRALFFALAGLMELFRYLSYGLAIILMFVGTKMLITATGVHLPTWVALGTVATILAVSIALSVLLPKGSRESGEQSEQESEAG